MEKRRTKKPIPEDIAEIRKQMMLNGIGYKELANGLKKENGGHYSEGSLKVMLTVSGKLSDKTKKKICDYLNIQAEPEGGVTSGNNVAVG